MATFPRTIMPRRPGEIERPRPLAIVTARGTGQVRAEPRAGGTWTEAWGGLPMLDPDVRALLATIRKGLRRGTIFDITHVNMPGSGQSPNGAGTSGVQVAGGSQAGTSLVTDGWPGSTSNVVRAGDVIGIPSIGRAFEIMADADSDSGGSATLDIDPPILAGSEPADNAAVDTTGVTLRARIENASLPQAQPVAAPKWGWLTGLEVTFRIMP